MFNFNFTLSAAVNGSSAAQWGHFSLRNPDSTTVDTSKKYTPPHLSRFPRHPHTLYQLYPFSHFCISGRMWTDQYLRQKSGLLDSDLFDSNRTDAEMTNSNIQMEKKKPLKSSLWDRAKPTGTIWIIFSLCDVCSDTTLLFYGVNIRWWRVCSSETEKHSACTLATAETRAMRVLGCLRWECQECCPHWIHSWTLLW